MTRKSQPPRPEPSRLRKSVVRGGAAVALALCLAFTAATAVLTESDPAAGPAAKRSPAFEPGARSPADVASTPSSSATPTRVTLAPRRAPGHVSDVVGRSTTTSDLLAWVADPGAEPPVRYAALRRLELEDPVEAVTAALGVLDDTTSLVRLNAIAVLTRASDPRAAAALEKLDGRSRQLALALGRR